MNHTQAKFRTGSFIKHWVLFIAFIGLFLSGVVQAHHSRSRYDLTHPIVLENAVIKEWRWTNPHTFLVVVVPGKNGQPEEWKLEGGSPSFLARDGFERTDIKIGDTISVTIYPYKDGSNGGSFFEIRIGDKVLKRESKEPNTEDDTYVETDPLAGYDFDNDAEENDHNHNNDADSSPDQQ